MPRVSPAQLRNSASAPPRGTLEGHRGGSGTEDELLKWEIFFRVTEREEGMQEWCVCITELLVWGRRRLEVVGGTMEVGEEGCDICWVEYVFCGGKGSENVNEVDGGQRQALKPLNGSAGELHLHSPSSGCGGERGTGPSLKCETLGLFDYGRRSWEIERTTLLFPYNYYYYFEWFALKKLTLFDVIYYLLKFSI